jgi:hypothetical protein
MGNDPKAVSVIDAFLASRDGGAGSDSGATAAAAAAVADARLKSSRAAARAAAAAERPSYAASMQGAAAPEPSLPAPGALRARASPRRSPRPAGAARQGRVRVCVCGIDPTAAALGGWRPRSHPRLVHSAGPPPAPFPPRPQQRPTGRS